LTGNEDTNAFEKTVDKTGDPYEDFPEDQDGKDDFDGPKIYQIAVELKDFGNTAFKAGDLNLGLDKYQKGLRYLNEYPSASEQDSADLGPQLTAIRFTLHSNSALLQNKLKAFGDAKQSASNALELKVPDADKAKAYYRRAIAEIGLKDDEEAVKDLEAALKLAPGDPAITKELSTTKKKAAEQAKKEAAAYKKFFT
jgi:peptidyl-prolyl isomerase D